MLRPPALRSPFAWLALLALAHPASAQRVVSSATAPFPHYESGPVRPLALSADGAHLYALNTPDHRLEVWNVGGAGEPPLTRAGDVFCGLEPVSLALHPHDPDLVFVANLLSDTVAVVDVARRRTIAVVEVGDEPQDLVVAGNELFVATARAGSGDPLAPGPFVSNAVVVLGIDAPWAVTARIEVPGHDPRALATDGARVWVVPQNSGNHTTVLSEPQAVSLGLTPLVLDAFDAPFELNPVLASARLAVPAFVSAFGVNGWRIPNTARIVLDHEHPSLVPQLADLDVIAIDAQTHALAPPHATGVGTTLLAIERNPLTGDLWVANTEARNRERFEPRIKGRAFENRVTIVPAGGGTPTVLALEPPLTTRQHAQPASLAFYDGPHGSFAYVGCLGTQTIVVLDAVSGALVAELDTGLLPSGFAVDAARARLFVLTRGEHALRAYDIAAGHAPIALDGLTHLALGYDPEPPIVRAGRRMLYDARASTGAGTDNFSCAACHVFGHADGLAWDLGDPAGSLGYFFPDLLSGALSFAGQPATNPRVMQTHPIKGPMVTQSLRGIGGTNMQPLHWRGDRRFFQMFDGAFRGLLGGSGVSERDMQAYTAFVDGLAFPPNPFQPKDRVYRADELAGRTLFGLTPANPGKVYNPPVPGNLRCVSCHKGDFANGDFSGSQETVNFDGESQLFNTAGLRGVYEKDFRALTGFGTLHDGSIDGIGGFLNATLGGMVAFPALTPLERSRVSAFVRAWDSGTPPAVGAQYVALQAEGAENDAWLNLAEGQAATVGSGVDLVAKVVYRNGAHERALGLVWRDEPGSGFQYVTSTGRRVRSAVLRRALTSGLVEAAFTVVPRGMGVRLGIDRDEDGLLDNQETWYGTDAADPDSDDDGYDDRLERELGSDPRSFDAQLAGDTRAPTLLVHEVRSASSTAATLHVVGDEPASATVELGTSPGDLSLASELAPDLRGAHDVVLSGLPEATTLFYRVTLRDKNGNAGEASGSFTTGPRMLHVDELGLGKSGSGPITLTASVRVVDTHGVALADVPVRGIWEGDIGGAPFMPSARTDTLGVATFTVGPYTPGAAGAVSFSPAYIGSNVASDPWYVGSGGQTPSFFYAQTRNAVSYRTIAVP